MFKVVSNVLIIIPILFLSGFFIMGVKELKPKGKTTDGLAGAGDVIAPFMLSFVASIWLVLVTVLISINKST
jgi:hypothetical protein